MYRINAENALSSIQTAKDDVAKIKEELQKFENELETAQKLVNEFQLATTNAQFAYGLQGQLLQMVKQQVKDGKYPLNKFEKST